MLVNHICINNEDYQYILYTYIITYIKLIIFNEINYKVNIYRELEFNVYFLFDTFIRIGISTYSLHTIKLTIRSYKIYNETAHTFIYIRRFSNYYYE